MRVAMYYNNRDVRLEEMPAPKIGPGELLMRVEASGICGSDVMEWYRIKKTPRVLGHEVAGEIVGVGEGVRRYRQGERVSASHHVPCNTCRYCLAGHHTVCDTLRSTNFDPGGFAEYIRLPAINVDRGVYLLPDELSFEEATFIEPLACVLRSQRMACLEPSQSVFVIGSGVSGLLHIKLACAIGAGRIVASDLSEYRLRLALQFGADAVIHAKDNIPTRLREVNNGHLAEKVIVCTGAPSAIAQAFRSVDRGGTVLFFAPTEPGVTIPLDLNEIFWGNDVTFTTSYGGSPADHMVALEMLRYRRVEVLKMITHRLSLAETGLGFQLVTEAQDSLKVIIQPQK